jgi:hypothetical protein
VAVDITWSESPGGAAITPPFSWGSIANGSSSDDDLYIVHDGTEKITDVGFYIQAYTGTYTGTFDAATDYAEILGWGNDDSAEGFLINQNHITSPPGTYVTHKTGQGTVTVPIDLDGDCITVASGGPGTDTEIGVSEEAHIKVRIAVPLAEGDAGTRQFDQCLKYTYTS